MKEMLEKGLDSDLWHACAGSMVQIPSLNYKVVYFPQGHAEHTLSSVDFGASPKISPMILCRVSAVKYLADFKTDEVYAKIGLVPVGQDQHGFDHYHDDGDGVYGTSRFESHEKMNPFSKTLTQSDANNGGGFSVPRYCAETVFPPLDYNADPPVQNLIAKDIVSCLLNIGFSCQKTEKSDDGMKTPGFVLFGQPILTEQQMSRNRSDDEVSQVAFGQTGKISALKGPPRSLSVIQFCGKQGRHNDAELGMETGRCKVFLESKDIGQTLNLSVPGSYDELYRKLEVMLGVEWSEMLSHLFYHDVTGVVKQAGDEPFSEFAKSGKSLSVFMKPNSENAAR